MFDQIFVSPQVKRSVIISNKHGTFKLPQELLNYFRLRILGHLAILIKSQNFMEL